MRFLRIIPALSLFVSLGACGGQGEEVAVQEAPEAYDEAGPPLVDATGKADDLGFALPANDPLPEGADLDAPLQALFAPDDPVSTLEAELVDRVRVAKEAGGEGPFRIRYAVYNLRNARIVEALAKAAEAGVEVRLLLEADQLDPARTWNDADEKLGARGFEVFTDHRDGAGDSGASLVGIKHPGLMHLKTRLYEAGEFQAALTGSMNPGDHAAANEETLHLVRDKRLIKRYSAAWEAVAGGRRSIDNEWEEGAAANVLFTPAGSGERAGARILRWLAEEDEQILLMVFSLRDFKARGAGGAGSLVDVLTERARAGVPVAVITDQKQSDGVDAEGGRRWFDDRTDDRLRAAGVQVFEVINRTTPYTAMHHKVAVLGRSEVRVISDAANWTTAGLGSATKVAKNVESVLFLDTAALDGGHTGRRYLAQWLRVLGRYVTGAEADELVDGLRAAEGWPVQPVLFEARDTHTEFGQGVRVRGDLEALGRWGELHAGVALSTDEASYPTWTAEAPVDLPLANALQWKLVVTPASGTSDRWEAGDNRTALAAPAPLAGDGPLTLVGSWRDN